MRVLKMGRCPICTNLILISILVYVIFKQGDKNGERCKINGRIAKRV